MFFFPTNVCEWKKIIELMIVFKGKKKGLEKYLIQYEKWCQRDARNQRFFFFFSDEIMMKLEVLSVFLFQSQESKLTNVNWRRRNRRGDTSTLIFWILVELYSQRFLPCCGEKVAQFFLLSPFFFSLLALALPCSRSPLKKVGLPPTKDFPSRLVVQAINRLAVARLRY